MADNNIPQLPSENLFMLSPEQKRLAELLSKRFGHICRDTYIDVCRLMTQGQTYKSQWQFFSHLIAELESTLRMHLLPLIQEPTLTDAEAEANAGREERIRKLITEIEYPNDCGHLNSLIKNIHRPDNHGKQIKRIIKVLGLEGTDAADTWTSFTGKKFSGLRHLNRQGRKEQQGETVLEYWKRFENLLRIVLDAADKKYSGFLDVIGGLKRSPSKANALKLKALPNNFLIQAQFFDGNNDPGWVEFLNQEKFFSFPPGSQEKIDDVTVENQPHWPAMEYLTRIAEKNPEKRSLILNIIKDLPKTDNRWVNNEVLKIGAVLPAQESIKLKEKIFESIDIHVDVLNSRDIKRLIETWAEGEFVDDALECANIFFAIRIPSDDSDDDYARSRFNESYSFLESLINVSGALAKAAPLKTFNWLLGLLEQCFKMEYPDGDDGYFYMCRPSIEIEDVHSKKILNATITGLVRCCVNSITNDGMRLIDVLEKLEQKNGYIYRRIVLFLLAAFPNKAPDLVVKHLMNKEYHDDFLHLESEYKTLALKGFEFLSEENKNIFLGWVDEFDEPDFRERFSKRKGEQPSSEQIQIAKDVSARDFLDGWAEIAPSEYAEKYKLLCQKYGPSVRPGVVTDAYWGGDKSPVTSAEIEKLTVEELVKFLKDWKPTGKRFEPNFEGLRLEVKKVVSGSVTKFSAAAEHFIGLRPPYVQAFFAGIKETAQNVPETQIEWNALIKLGKWVITEYKNEDVTSPPDWESETTWQWSVESLIELLDRAFLIDQWKFPTQLIDDAWPLISSPVMDLLRPKEEASDIFDEDRYEAASNTLEGKAASAAIHFALFARRQREGKYASGSMKADMPHVLKFFDLLLTRDDLKSVRSIFGRLFPWVSLLDKEWAARNSSLIFQLPLHSDPSWRAYITYCRPYGEIYAQLEPFYIQAANELNQLIRKENDNYQSRLPSHIMGMLILNDLQLSPPDILIEKFVTNATDDERAKAIEALGKSLKQPQLEVPLQKRAIEYGEMRLAAIESQTDRAGFKEEIYLYGLWIKSPHLSVAWKYDLLERILALGGKIYDEKKVLKFLSENLVFCALRTLGILEKILFKTGIESWEISFAREEIENILKKSLENSNDSIRKQATDVINRLVANNFASFHQLLKSDDGIETVNN